MAIINDISYDGQDTTASLNGSIRLEEARARLLVANPSSNRVIQLGQMDNGHYGIDWFDSITGVNYMSAGERPDGTYGFDVALEGIDVKTAGIDDLILSSKFNLYKIIHYGSITSPTPRNATVTLSGNNIGYVFDIYVDIFNGSGTDQQLDGDLLINICWNKNKVPIGGSGVFYDNGTNKVNYKWTADYLFDSQFIHIKYELRLMAGTYSFNPSTSDRVPFRNSFYYQVANMTHLDQSGMGGVGAGDGKFYYRDAISYLPDGTVLSALSSTTLEFTNGDWAYFPAAAL